MSTSPLGLTLRCFTKFIEKDKLHKLFKQKKTLQAELKFKVFRREFKSLISSKMRANLDYCNRNILTKKFWSHVKSSKNSSRIPEVIFLRRINCE